MNFEYYVDTLQDAKVKQLTLAFDVLIDSLVPQLIRSLKWKIPFYTYHKDLCYTHASKGRFYIAFIQGWALEHHDFLDHSGKVMSKLYIDSVEEMNKPYVSELIVEASMINEELANGGKKTKSYRSR